MYFNREISGKLLGVAQSFPALVLTGARQVGKTTLLKECFPDHTLVSLDLPSNAELAENEPRLFLDRYPPPVIIDEVQYAPGLFRNLKVEIDRDRHRMGQFILTGSQKFNLMKEVSDSLAGRIAVLNLETLSVDELGVERTTDLNRLLSRGMYPELWRNPSLDLNAYYESYLATYLERDVRQILNVQSLRDFERFIRACAARSGQLLNMSDLGRDVGIKSQTVKDWLSVLEASNQISLLEPYYENVGKRMVKSPKLYLNDSGMLCFLLAVDPQSLSTSPLIGAIFETFVYAEFRKRLAASPYARSLWYYRDSQGREIDLVLMQKGSLNLYEIKWSERPDKRWHDRLAEVGEVLSSSHSQLVGSKNIICRIDQHIVEHGTNLYPATDWAI
jgi:uncharacterized protein